MIAGYMVDISDPANWDFTGTSIIPESQHHLPRASAFYIGGNTPHVWTLSQIQRQSNDYRLPIWVYDPSRNTAVQGTLDGKKAATFCDSLGMPKNAGLLIALDMETSVNPAYCSAFRDAINAAGYWYTVYESESVSGNPTGTVGRWGANWTGIPHIVSGDWATQFTDPALDHHPFDLSAVSSFEHLWNITGVHSGNPVPPPLPTKTIVSVTITYSDKTTEVFKP